MRNVEGIPGVDLQSVDGVGVSASLFLSLWFFLFLFWRGLGRGERTLIQETRPCRKSLQPVPDVEVSGCPNSPATASWPNGHWRWSGSRPILKR